MEDQTIKLTLLHGTEALVEEKVVVQGAKEACKLFRRLCDVMNALVQAEARQASKEG